MPTSATSTDPAALAHEIQRQAQDLADFLQAQPQLPR